MCERNVEPLRRAIEAFNAGDVDALMTYVDSDYELRTVLDTVYRGRVGARDWYQEQAQFLGDEIRLEPHAHFAVGDRLVSFGVVHARGPKSGASIDSPITIVTRWRDGLCVYMRPSTDRQQALDDLGVTEDELEPIAP